MIPPHDSFLASKKGETRDRERERREGERGKRGESKGKGKNKKTEETVKKGRENKVKGRLDFPFDIGKCERGNEMRKEKEKRGKDDRGDGGDETEE